MCRPNIASMRRLLVLAGLSLLMMAATVAAQTSTTRTSGAPLKGVDVKLGRYAGAQFAGAATVATTQTDDKGHFAFPVLPRGQYVLTVSVPANRAKQMNEHGAAADAAVKFCTITLDLANGKSVTMNYDLARDKAFDVSVDPANAAAMRAAKFVAFIVVSDGAQPCNGTIVKSKSNITNN